MYLAMLTLPLLGSIFSGFFLRKVGLSRIQFTTFTLGLHSLLNVAYSNLEWCLNSPPKPHAFVTLPLQSSIWNRLIYIIVSRKYKILISITGSIMLLIPLRMCMSLLDIMDFYPILAGFYTCLLLSVTLMFESRDVPKLFSLIFAGTFAALLAYCIYILDFSIFNELKILLFGIPMNIATSNLNTSSPLYMNNNNPDTGSNNTAGVSNNSGSSTNNVTNPQYTIDQSLENYNKLSRDTERNKLRLRHRMNRFNTLVGELNTSSSRKNMENDRRRILASLSLVRQELLDKCAELEALSETRNRTLEQLKIQHRHYNNNLSNFRLKNHKHDSAKSIMDEARALANRSL